jgi:hypothetical protein
MPLALLLTAVDLVVIDVGSSDGFEESLVPEVPLEVFEDFAVAANRFGFVWGMRCDTDQKLPDGAADSRSNLRLFGDGRLAVGRLGHRCPSSVDVEDERAGDPPSCQSRK